MGGGSLPTEIPSRELFNQVKNNPSEYDDWYVGLIEFFASFCAKGFGGSYGAIEKGTINKYGGRLNTFLKQLESLRGIDFICQDINQIEYTNALIYIDPPYRNTQKYDTSKDFNYDTFWNTARKLSRDNIVFVSEQEAPDDFKSIWTLETKRTIAGSKKIATENLFYYDGQN